MSDSIPPDAKTGFDSLLDFLSLVCKVLTGISLVVLTAIFGWLVFGRYVLNSTPTWVEQVSLLLIVLIGFLGASVGVHENSHLGVSIFRELCSKRIRRGFEFVSHILMAIFGVIMAVNSYELAVFKWGSEIPLIHLPEGLRVIPIMLCGVLVFLYSIGHLIHFFKGIEEEYDLTK